MGKRLAKAEAIDEAHGVPEEDERRLPRRKAERAVAHARRLSGPRVSLAMLIVMALWGCEEAPVTGDDLRADPRDGARVAAGSRVYALHCAACHGAALEGQPDWRRRLPHGRMPAPPHDESGHTWHHPDAVLFAITKNGLKPPNAPPGYESDMPAFGETLNDDEIWSVLAYIKSHWKSPDVLAARREMIRHTKK